MPQHHEIPSMSPEATAFAERLTSLIPTLYSDRLKLRAPKLTDFPFYADIALSEKGRFILEEPSRENAWFDFVNMVACWLLRGHGLWAVENNENYKVIGFVFVSFEPGDHEPELGYILRDQAEGFGFATEAALRAKQYAFQELGVTTLVSTIDHENVSSLKVAERLGGIRDAKAEQAHDNKIMVLRYSATSSS